ncbi:MAG: signal peptide peptidase SppA [Gammaproteobacteria bacterium]|nr:signal peptide peptidase SppA [Gammaproteobacteria bacterium]MDP2140119.1 signal peptide peptidase SppA [Gammaproteobacteria bacterium]MDP2346323.1 signal peptide peptidase SppA [Gammaproteobacteria bacterium]
MAQTSFIGRFFRFLGRSIDFIGRLLSRVLLLLFIGIVLILIFSGSEPLQIPNGGLVVIEPQGAVVEQSSLPDPANLLLGATEVTSTPLRDILDTLERAAADDRIAGVVLSLGEMTSISPANLETIGEALEGYKTSGKVLIAHGDYFGQAQYLLASYADTVYLHPMGQVLLPGYGGSQLFFSELLDKLGVNVHIFRVGTHKAAVEPFSLNGMSDESRANSQQLVDELWTRYLTQVATNRGLSEQLLRSYTNDFADHLLASDGDMAQTALEHGLVDELISQPELRTRIRELTGPARGDNGPRTIGFQQYLLLTNRPHLPMQDEVGVIIAQGTIDIGEQPRGMIGADSLNALIREARMNDRVKAVVLRVDSPGGSALASELIRQELEQLQSVGKPLVISMGGTAASGGYWIAAMADEIWASPATVTGSIGIFGMIPTFEEGMASLGVYADGVSTTPLSRADVFTGMSEPMARVFQASVEDGYRRFLRLVSEGRGMTLEQVDAIGQGQVWSGTQALEFGLVDNLGDLDDAVESAARMAALTDYGVRYIDRPLSPGEQLLQEIVRNMGMAALLSYLPGADTASVLQGNAGMGLPAGGAFAAWQRMFSDVVALARFNDPMNLYSLCEFCALLR